MLRFAALIVNDSPPLRFAGLDLADRAMRIVRRTGITQARVAVNDHPFAEAPAGTLLLVYPQRVIVEPRLVADLVIRGLRGEEDAVVAHGTAGDAGLMLLAPKAVDALRAAASLEEAHHLLERLVVTRINPSPRFLRLLRGAEDVASLEASYLHHVNGGDSEGFFTRNIRRFSIPLSRRLLRLPIGANAVTLAGFALAVLAGLSFVAGTYWSGVAGALLYWASMVLDCSDGEVARGRLSESAFGAWLETITDYLSYFVVLGGIVWGDFRREGFDHHTTAAIVAAAASLAVVVIVGYLRARTARTNPGAFDDALAAELRGGTPVQRFAVWSRQLIKRSFMAHLIVFQAFIGFLPALTEIWAYGAVGALFVVVAVQTHIVRRVRVTPLHPAETH